MYSLIVYLYYWNIYADFYFIIIINMQPQQESSTQIRPHNHQTSPSSFNIPFSILTLFNKILPILLFFSLAEYKILDFTLVLLFASVDFWCQKNIMGKKLVGMAWWMKWIFYSNPHFDLNRINEAFFWSCLLGSTIFWGFTSVISLLISHLFWISVCGVCFLLSGINFGFFMRCRGKHQERFKGLVDKIGLQSVHRLVGQS